MLIFCFFSLICCQNIIRNPSFEVIDSYNKIVNWTVPEGSDLSSDSISGKNSLHWKTMNKTLSCYQLVKIDKGFQYELCIHFKIINTTIAKKRGIHFGLASTNKTKGIYEKTYSRRFFGSINWRKACHITPIFNKPNNDLDNYYFSVFSYAQPEPEGEIFIDEISVRRINFRITINNDRDEIYDIVNVVYQINGDKENYNLSDFELTTIIKDSKKIFYNEKIKKRI